MACGFPQLDSVSSRERVHTLVDGTIGLPEKGIQPLLPHVLRVGCVGKRGRVRLYPVVHVHVVERPCLLRPERDSAAVITTAKDPRVRKRGRTGGWGQAGEKGVVLVSQRVAALSRYWRSQHCCEKPVEQKRYRNFMHLKAAREEVRFVQAPRPSGLLVHCTHCCEHLLLVKATLVGYHVPVAAAQVPLAKKRRAVAVLLQLGRQGHL